MRCGLDELRLLCEPASNRIDRATTTVFPKLYKTNNHLPYRKPTSVAIYTGRMESGILRGKGGRMTFRALILAAALLVTVTTVQAQTDCSRTDGACSAALLVSDLPRTV